MFRVGQTHTQIGIYGVFTVFLAGNNITLVKCMFTALANPTYILTALLVVEGSTHHGTHTQSPPPPPTHTHTHTNVPGHATVQHALLHGKMPTFCVLRFEKGYRCISLALYLAC
jgi:hypothetical protein